MRKDNKDSKVVIGKNANGTYVPPKGKPSGEGTSKAGLKSVNDLENLDEHYEIADKYTEGPDTPAANVKIMHPNRVPNTPDQDDDTNPRNNDRPRNPRKRRA
ncbi:hypothetical protein Q0590_03985 [Rhodocytophaga aerolata]|uniref:DUF3892 domain-containing protein n=1 Tax=Rhodocytophaga aerolata TaxID=455078 RepID=A0ABT8QZX2_9BACT|nr:hypothetical protein [Rhodocytophaga aerolata]MDO1445395.1 hypothetical protein [Rhodocytophaga aerolata]